MKTGGWEHGTASGYSNHRCRCGACKAAQSSYMAARYVKPCRRGCGRDAWYGPNPERTGVCLVCTGRERRTAVHGTETRYSSGCRCAPCVRAGNDARNARRHNDPSPGAHGANAYKNGCRCDVCRAANTAYSRRYRARLGGQAA